MRKTTGVRYTLQFKRDALELVKSGLSIATAARSVGVNRKTLYDWSVAQREGRLTADGKEQTSLEKREIDRLRTELAQVKMERDILKKAVDLGTHGVTHLHGTQFEGPHRSKDDTQEWLDWSI